MQKNNIEIRVCMGTGGIASGGAEVLDAFRREFETSGIDAMVRENCSAHKVGCRGLCAKDVLVDVAIDNEKVTYRLIQAPNNTTRFGLKDQW